MPYTESSKKSIYQWRDNHKDEYNNYIKEWRKENHEEFRKKQNISQLRYQKKVGEWKKISKIYLRILL
jgi:hypothetical protein